MPCRRLVSGIRAGSPLTRLPATSSSPCVFTAYATAPTNIHRCFIIPAALLVMFVDKPTLADRLQRLAAWAVGLLGLALFLNVFVGLYLSATQPHAKPLPPSLVGVEDVAGLAGAGSMAMSLHAWLWRAAARVAGPGSDGSLREVLRWAGWGA